MSDLVERLREFRLNDFYESKLVLTQEAAARIKQLEQACRMAYSYLSGNYVGPRSIQRDVVIVELRDALGDEES